MNRSSFPRRPPFAPSHGAPLPDRRVRRGAGAGVSRGAGLLRACLAFLLAGAVPTLAGPEPASAQEVRAGGGYAFPNIQGVPDSWGEGIGFRWFRDGLGLGVEYDRFSASNRFRGPACFEAEEGGQACFTDDLAFDSNMDALTLLVIGELVRSEEWRVRLMLGRTAGTIRGSGVGEQTGGTAEPPPADRGVPLLSWNRGADGSLFGIELLRALPLPGQAVHLRGALRSHRIEMHGCEVGTYSPFCGHLSLTEVQLGALVMWPRRGG
jgi:hypothetical protein